MIEHKQYTITKTKDGVTKSIYLMGKAFPENSISESVEQERLDKMVQEELDE